MRQYTEEFYSILRNVLEDISLQDFVDEVEANRYNQLNIPGFVFGDIQDENTFSQISRERNIVPMAILVDYDSRPKPFANQGIEEQHGNIPRHKTRWEFNEQDIRKVRKIQKLSSGNRSATAAAEEILSNTTFQINSHNNRMSYMTLQMMSKNMYEATIENNNYGITGPVFTGGIPASNIATKAGAARWWTDATMSTEGTASNPIEDLKEMVNAAEYDRNLRGVILTIARPTAKKLASHSKVVAAIAASTYPNAGSEPWATAAVSGLTWENRLQRLGELVGASFEVIDHVSAIEVFDPSTGKFVYPRMDSFDPGVVTLRTAGTVGQILAQEPLRISPEGVHYASFWGGRGLMSVEWDIIKKIEYADFEETALPLFYSPQNIFILSHSGADVNGADGSSDFGSGSKLYVKSQQGLHPKPAMAPLGSPVAPASASVDTSKKAGRPKTEETKTVNVESEE